MSKCKEFWNKELFYFGVSEDKTVTSGGTGETKVEVTYFKSVDGGTRPSQKLLDAAKKKTIVAIVDKDSFKNFRDYGYACKAEAESQVSIPTASGIAVGATTLGVGGGIAGVYLIPKLIKLFVT